MSKLVMQEIDPMQMDAFSTDLRDILLNHGHEMAGHHANTLEGLMNLIDMWADERSGLTPMAAFNLERALSPMPDLIPHWAEVWP